MLRLKWHGVIMVARDIIMRKVLAQSSSLYVQKFQVLKKCVYMFFELPPLGGEYVLDTYLWPRERREPIA
jgi:hypothetical protein